MRRRQKPRLRDVLLPTPANIILHDPHPLGLVPAAAEDIKPDVTGTIPRPLNQGCPPNGAPADNPPKHSPASLCLPTSANHDGPIRRLRYATLIVLALLVSSPFILLSLPIFFYNPGFYHFDGELRELRAVSGGLLAFATDEKAPSSIVPVRVTEGSLGKYLFDQVLDAVQQNVNVGIQSLSTETTRLRNHMAELDAFSRVLAARQVTGQAIQEKKQELMVAMILDAERRIGAALHALESVQGSRALEKLDGTGMADFALFSSGARVAVEMTSRTYSSWKGFWADRRAKQGHGPGVVLLSDITVGNCWALSGPTGQLGISLSRPIRLTHVTVDHPMLPILHDPSSAPRAFQVWMKIQGERNIFQRWWSSRDVPQGPWRTRYLGTFNFQPNNSTTFETYSLGELGPAILRLPTDGLVIKFGSNWGHPEYTCIYRIRAHGVPVS